MKRFSIYIIAIILCFTAAGCRRTAPLRTIPAIPPENESKTILILGNSFIGSSQIGEFLNNMLKQAGSEYSVVAIAQGYATVSTYSCDPEWMAEISRGNYCYVFQCGFYTPGEKEEFEAIKQVCSAANTGIIAFPAHNEDPNAVDKISKEDCLNWKAEIDALIAAGVPYEHLCMDDMHQHSTPLAGYIGAHLIYRNLFDEIPPELGDGAPLTAAEVTEQLGNYVKTGVINMRKSKVQRTVS